jgi:hypothetical protein
MSKTIKNLINDIIETPHMQVEFRRGDKQIYVTDKDDRNNEPAAVTTQKRGLHGVWLVLSDHHRDKGDGMTFRDVLNVLKECNIRYHYWCRMD